MGQPRKPWYRHVSVWFLLVLGTIAVIVAAGLQPFAAWETRRTLHHLKGYRGEFGTVHLSLVPLQYTLTNLTIVDEHAPSWMPPMLYADRFTVGLDTEKLVRRQVVASVTLERAKFSMHEQPKPEKKAARLGEELSHLLPFDLNRLEVKDSQLLYVLGQERGSPQIWLHDVNATLENLASRANLSQGVTTLALRGTVAHSGAVSAFVTADPLKKDLTFAGRAELIGLQLRDVNSLLYTKADLQAGQGSVDVFAQFEAKDGEVSGGVKPVLKNVSVKTRSPDLLDKLKAGLADAGLKLFSDRVPGRNAVATIIPIKGDLRKPDTQLWPTVLGVIRNAFVEGFAESFKNVPPPTASKNESPLTQARRALSKHGTEQAQPPKRK